jgi:WD40 repeat protein
MESFLSPEDWRGGFSGGVYGAGARSGRVIALSLQFRVVRPLATITGISTAPEAVSISESMRMMFLNKLKTLVAAVMLLILTGTGVGRMALRPQAAKESAPPPVSASADKPLSSASRVDLYGDPLPDGALLRLGTLQRRAVKAQIAVSPDGSSLVSVRGGKYVAIWDAATGRLRQRRELPVDAELFMGLAELSPDGRWLAAERSGTDTTVTIWEVRTGKRKRDLLLKETGPVYRFAFAPDGERLAVVGVHERDGFVRIWKVSDGQRIFDQSLRAHSCERLIFTPDGKRLLASVDSWQGALYCWDIDSGRQLWRSKEFEPYPLVVTPDGKVLCWQQHESPALDLATGRRGKIRLPPDVEKYSQLFFSPDGRTLLLSRSGDMTVWDYLKGEPRLILKRAGEQAVFLPDGKSVVTNNGALQRWDLASGKAVWPDTFAWGHFGEVTALAFSADGRRLASGSGDGSVRWWDTTTGRPLHTWGGHERPAGLAGGPDAPSGVTALALTPDGSRLLSAGWGGILRLHDTRGDRLHSLPLPSDDFLEGPPRAYHLRISGDGSRAVGLVGGEFFRSIQGHETDKRTHRLATWDLQSGRLATSRDVPLNALILSPDGHAVLLAGGVLRDAETGKEIVRMQEMPNRSPCEFSADGALIVSRFNRLTRTKEGTIYNSDGACVWETVTGKRVAQVKRNGWVAAAGFHPNNRFVVLNNLTGVELWDLLRGEAVAFHKMPEKVRAGNTKGSFANCFAVSPDGRRLATGMPDGTILLWDVPLPASKPHPLERKELESLWTDLGDADAAKAWRAVWRLLDAPQDALAFLRDRVKPYLTAPAEVTRKLLADLDSDSFEVREAAMKRLKELGLQAEPALRAALTAKPSLEMKRRIEPILAALSETLPKPTPEHLRQLRALIVLERIPSSQARHLLREIANGPPSARLTRQARAALACQRD